MSRSPYSVPCLWFLLSIFPFAGCVVPPNLEPRYLPQDEVTLLSHAQRGKQYALAGRTELAEKEFREAIRMSPKQSSFYNDLGFVLQGADRHEEAIAAFRRALELEPQSLSPRVNMARSFHKTGRIHEAITVLKEAAEIYEKESAEAEETESAAGDTVDEAASERREKREQKRNAARLGNSSFATRDLVAVYQNLAFLSALLGFDDDAVCYARLAVEQQDALFGLPEYARFLLSIGRVSAARAVLSDFLTAAAAAPVPTKVILDYGVTLFLTGEREQAAAAFARAADDETADIDTRLYASMLGYMTAKAAGGDGTVKERETVLLEDRELCNNWHGARITYWPATMEKEMETLARGYCGEDVGRPKEDSLFSGRIFDLLNSTWHSWM